MSDKTFGRVVIAVCLVVLLLLALSSCATVQPEKKSAIPSDLVLVCYQGQYAIYSQEAQEAQEARILPIQCKDDSDI